MSFQYVKKNIQKLVPPDGGSVLSTEEGTMALKELAEVVRSTKVRLAIFEIGNEKGQGRQSSPEKRKNIRHIPPGATLDLWDVDIKKSSAFRFAMAINEKIDVKKIENNDKDYIALWTNRVAMWRLFEHLVSPYLHHNFEDLSPMLKYQSQSLLQFSHKNHNLTPNVICNPFSEFGHGFKHIMNTWMPCMKKLVRIYAQKTRGGLNLKEDFMSIATMAFLHALEKQALAIIANPKQAQGLPFPKRLEYAVRKAIYSEIPDLTGPIRVSMENPLRKTMPVEVGIDPYFDENQS